MSMELEIKKIVMPYTLCISGRLGMDKGGGKVGWKFILSPFEID
jgi:hypothetical protein